MGRFVLSQIRPRIELHFRHWFEFDGQWSERRKIEMLLNNEIISTYYRLTIERRKVAMKNKYNR